MKTKLKNITSNTGKFVDGNPNNGELGTIVTAEWLNGIQERTQDYFEELRNVLLLANTTPDPSKTNQIAEAIKSYISSLSASTAQKGLVQLTNDTGLDSDVLALTAKAGKAIAQSVAQLQINVYNKLDQKINKDDISDSVTSTSQTTVASSKAVKTAHDKGVEANNNANGRVNKSGDTMTGDLIVPYLKALGRYLSVTANNGDVAGLEVIRQGSQGSWLTRLEALPDKRFKIWVQNSHDIFFPARGGTVILDSTLPTQATRWPNAGEQGYTQSLAENGWTKLPNGLIIQWGQSTSQTIHFPIAFPSKVFAISHSKTGGGRDTRIANISKTGFSSFATGDVGRTFYVAIGV